MGEIRPCIMNHVDRYGEIYAKAFSGEPWNDPWKQEDAVIHVKEILEMRQSYGLEYIEDGLAVGFLLGSSMLFMKASGIVGIHLITANEGFLPDFYERYGFCREKEVILMGMELPEKG